MFAVKTKRTPVRAKVVTILGLACLSLVFVSPSHAQDEGAPPWGIFLKKFGKDKLLKPPFAEAPEATPKGLAAKIRARELDIPNRLKAVRYLGDLDCSQFPEAKEMLILAMQEDRWEEVRFAAAKALRDMLARNSCGPNGGAAGQCRSDANCNQSTWDKCVAVCKDKLSKKDSKNGKRGRKDEGVEDCHCKNCCDEDTLNAIAKTAYEMDDAGCPIEPSLRVREMAVEAISACGIPCHYKPYYATSEEPVPVEPVEPVDPEMIKDTPEVEGDKPTPAPMPEVEVEVKEAKLPPLPRVTETQPTVKTEVVPTPIDQLDKICIVSWRNGETVKPSAEFESAHKGRLYHFANAECKASFDAAPETFAVAYGGCDPVHYLKTKQPLVGRFLADCNGRFYLFASHENLEEFNANPEVYTPGSKRTVRVASAQE
jgi:YHS domain-containing protein